MSSISAGLASASSGCYEAARAASLSGVPERTVYNWAHRGLIIPSVSPVQEKLWSYADLMALRLVAWLRRPKAQADDDRLPANPMSQVTAALSLLARSSVPIWTDDAPDDSPVVVDQAGAIFVRVEGSFLDLQGNVALPHEQSFGLLNPFEFGGLRGPDLRKPRPDLRIIPSRVAGEPHVTKTRITTQALVALVDRDYPVDRVADMYGLGSHVVAQAIDLESSLVAA